MRNIPKLIFRLVFLLAGTALLTGGAYTMFRGRQAGNWPTAQGQIISAEVIKINRSGSSPSYKPVVRYTYLIDGESHNGSRIGMISQTYGKQADAEKKLLPYPPGTEVKVYYSNEDPGKGLLETGIHIGSYFMIAVGLIMISIGFLAGKSG